MPGAGIETPNLSLPKGGGALRGIVLDGLAVNAPEFRGGARLTIPIDLPSARGAEPKLSLTYDSGAGNGPFGAGASIELPSIIRSTALGVPSYTDSDSVLFSETGLLVERGSWSAERWAPAERTITDVRGETWLVREYLPRRQSAFPLIERWTSRLDDRSSHWRVVSADNVESRFGVTSDARISNPDDPSQILEWLIEETTDAKGNSIHYSYKAEDGQGGVPRLQPFTNRYIERIEYGNYFEGGNAAFAFQIVFDYGEYDLDELSEPGSNPYVPVRPWLTRADAYSSYRPGFDLRTNRLCRGILTFHSFPDALGAGPCLTAAIRFDYTESPYLACLKAVTRWGYRKQPDSSYAAEALPPVTLDFTDFDPPPAPQFRRLDVERQADLPGYLMPGAYQPADLDGEGIPGFLQSNGAVTHYYAPLGGGRYAAARSPTVFPDSGNLANPRLALTDLDADGRLELLVTGETEAGFFRHLNDGGWGGFEPISHHPTLDGSSSAELVDLNGNGLADLLMLRRTTVQHYPSLGEAGYAPMRATERPHGFPSAAANSATERVVFADIFGDGLAHRVRVTDGEVEVWPSLGHGRFGSKVTLSGAPRFAGTLQASRCYFVDLDGTGAADLAIAASDKLIICRNRSGNGFSAPFTVPLPFRLGANDQLSFADILGNGTTAIVATRTSPAVEHWFCDLSSPAGDTGTKPFLLARMNNGFGATTEVSYRSSTSFYLTDKSEGRAWPTRLPFPVQVVESLTVTDAVTGASTRQRFRYHDGYYDGAARSFRGFGYVETWREQHYAPFEPAQGWPVDRVNADLRVTPGYSRSWYATGAYFESAALARQYAREYYSGDPDAARLPADAFDPAILAAGGTTLRQAYAALTGRAIRAEHYADEGAAQQSAAPYVVSEANYTVQLVQVADPKGIASVMVRDREGLKSVYEREASDPRVEHSFLLRSTLLDADPTDNFYERRCTVCYARRPGAESLYPEQYALKVGVDETWSTRVSAPFRMIGTQYEQRSLDVGGLTPPVAGIYGFDEIARQVAAALEALVPYGEPFSGDTPQARPAQHVQRCFWNEAQTEALALGRISARALLHHEQHAVFSRQWLDAVFESKLSDNDLTDLAGLIEDANGYWWNPGTIRNYFTSAQPDRFFLPSGTVSPSQAAGLFQQSTVEYDAPYCLLPVAVTHYADASTPIATSTRYDYQALQPSQVTDANGIVRQALYTPLGLVLVASTFKPADGSAPRVGDGDLADYVIMPDASFASVLEDPRAYLQQAGAFYFCDLSAWIPPTSRPLSCITLARTRFVSDEVPDAAIEVTVDYTDGLGRPAERKLACEPATAGGPVRWLASERMVHDGHGEPVQSYFPFYTAAPDYESQQSLADANLVPPPQIEVRDPMGRAIRTATPKGFFTRTVYGAWQTARHDEDDTILDAPFYIDFMAHYPPQPTQTERDEKAALDKAAPFYNTPTIEILDNGGHAIRRIASNLGNVPPDAFAGIVSGTVTSEALWSALLDAGYLETSSRPQGTWVTSKFQPYTQGFELSLPPPYDEFAGPAAAILTQSRLTTLLVVDNAGRLLQATDPRLFLAEAQGGGQAFSARYRYPMAGYTAARSDSADAGARWQLASLFDTTVLSLDAMGRRREQRYDGLLRLLTTVVTESDGVARTVEKLTYGERRPDAAVANLIGQVYRIEDEAGRLEYPAYTILGQAAQSVRQFAVEYKQPLDWANPVPLDPARFETDVTYDAMRRVVTETLPDTSSIVRQYWPSGRLSSITVTPPGGTSRPFITAITYAADDQRSAISFGNGLTQTLSYEASTRRLITLSATRPDRGPGGMPRDPVLQSVDYTYDPVGNVSIVRDRTAQLLFCGATEPEALGDYIHDALYRLVAATGLQHPGITANTHVTGFMQSLYAELCPEGTPPVALETYAESYVYDLSGNLIETRHSAASASFERACPVAADSNRLADVPYDANGNPLATQLSAAVPLVWESRSLLAQSGPFERPDGGFDNDYNLYDLFGGRVRRVVLHGTDVCAPPADVDEDLVVGSYVLKRRTDETTGDVTSTSILRIQDAAACFVVTDTLAGKAPEIRYQLADRLASVSVEIGQDCGVISYEAYYPFGGTAIIAGSDQTIVARKLLRYSGKPADDGTGFYDYGARFYLPWQGRWLNPDPAGAADGLNQFQFVGGNPVTLLDTDGRGKDDPAKPLYPEWTTGFLKGFVIAALAGVTSAPRQAFYYAPINISRRLGGTKEERARARANASARLEETRLIYYGLLLAHDIDPEKYLPAEVIRYIKPRTQPWSTTNIPFYGRALHRELRNTVRQPDFWASQLGSGFGSFLTVGATLAIVRNLIRPAPFSLPAVLATATLSTVLTTIGQGEESDRVYDRYQAEQAKLWFWQRSYRPTLSGAPRRLAYTDLIEQRARQLWNEHSAEQLILLGAAAVLYRFLGPFVARQARQRAGDWWREAWRSGGFRPGGFWTGGSRAPGTALVVWRQRQLALRVKPKSGALAPVGQQPNQLVVYEAPAKSLVAVRPKTTALVPVRPKPSSVQPYRPPVTALVSFVERTRALQIYRPQLTALVPRGLPPSAIPRAGLAGLVALGGSLIAYQQFNRKSKK